ncbi:MAG TPA: 2,3-bisphosphoglycerate-dependent phosphoglycerate mutase, partial [Bacteroidetes bacterium]|nr:2,3-bisphosphoglycerate-dependent phosphoglycerate mutase [Bacteroidota bacterium]
MARLTLLRHGESQWNLENRFTGWVDVDLSAKGEAEARRAGTLLREVPVDVLFTSVLKRAMRTAEIALTEAGRTGLPTHRDQAL